VHPLYQDQVVFNEDEVEVALTKPRKWSTQSSMVVIHISQNHNLFHVFTLQTLSIGSYQRLATFLSRSKRLETRSLVSKFGKPPKPLKTKFVVKSTLKNQNRYRAQSCEMYSKTLSFWSKGWALINLCLNSSKTLAKPYKYSLKNHSRKRERGEEKLIKKL
jgi:hypothetical protein